MQHPHTSDPQELGHVPVSPLQVQTPCSGAGACEGLWPPQCCSGPRRQWGQSVCPSLAQCWSWGSPGRCQTLGRLTPTHRGGDGAALGTTRDLKNSISETCIQPQSYFCAFSPQVLRDWTGEYLLQQGKISMTTVPSGASDYSTRTGGRRSVRRQRCIAGEGEMSWTRGVCSRGQYP